MHLRQITAILKLKIKNRYFHNGLFTIPIDEKILFFVMDLKMCKNGGYHLKKKPKQTIKQQMT